MWAHRHVRLPHAGSIEACRLLTELAGKHPQGHQGALRFPVPGRTAIEPYAMIKLLGITENQPRRDADPLLQRPHMQLLGVNPAWQTDPQYEPATGTRHLRALGEILLDRQLKCAEVFPVLLPDMPQMAVIPAIFKVGRNTHLRHAAR